MNKGIITDYLRKFDYDFTENENQIIVKQDFNLKIYIDLSDDGKIKINDKLDSLNFLSWPFSMSIKGTMTYNFISSFIVFVLFLALRNSINNYILTLVVIFSAFWNLYWLIYYLNKSDSLKKEIKNLTK
jgi:hypothetical protein